MLTSLFAVACILLLLMLAYLQIIGIPGSQGSILQFVTANVEPRPISTAGFLSFVPPKGTPLDIVASSWSYSYKMKLKPDR